MDISINHLLGYFAQHIARPYENTPIVVDMPDAINFSGKWDRGNYGTSKDIAQEETIWDLLKEMDPVSQQENPRFIVWHFVLGAVSRALKHLPFDMIQQCCFSIRIECVLDCD
jgi:hypothetical protein